MVAWGWIEGPFSNSLASYIQDLSFSLSLSLTLTLSLSLYAYIYIDECVFACTRMGWYGAHRKIKHAQFFGRIGQDCQHPQLVVCPKIGSTENLVVSRHHAPGLKPITPLLFWSIIGIIHRLTIPQFWPTAAIATAQLRPGLVLDFLYPLVI